MNKLKLSNKGFTLVELLVVLVILSVIMTIAIPSITSSIERSKQKQKDSKIQLIESAAELYVDRHKNGYSTNSTYTIYMKDIICDGLLTKEEAKDPFNEDYTLCGYVAYTRSSNTYEWRDMGSNNTHRLKIDDTLSC